MPSGGAPSGGGRPAAAIPAGTAASKPANATQAPPTDPAAVVNAVGTWTYTIESPRGGGGTLTLRKEGDTYSGVVVSSTNNRETPLSSVVVNGNELTYTYDMAFGPNTTTIQVKSIITGDEMTGTMTLGQFGSFPVKGKRNP
jgi:hypothetical protein